MSNILDFSNKPMVIELNKIKDLASNNMINSIFILTTDDAGIPYLYTDLDESDSNTILAILVKEQHRILLHELLVDDE